MKKIKIIFLFSIVFISVFYSRPIFAQEKCEKTIVNVTARNGDGDFIPNVNFEIYEQEIDVDGLPKPGKRIASGKTDAVLGRGQVSFTDEHGDFVIKYKVINKDIAAYYFYDYNFSCGEEVDVEERLSSIKFSIRNTEGKLLKNQSFSVYTQRYDIDGQPIKEKQDLVGTFNTSAEGEYEVFVPSEDCSIDGSTGVYYIVETSSEDKGVFEIYDISLSSGNEEDVEYVLSDFKLVLKDKDGALFPAKTKIKIYYQTDKEGEKSLGSLVKEIYTDDNGEAILTYPAGFYAVQVDGADGNTETFWDLEIINQERTVYELTMGEGWQPGNETCEQKSNLNLLVKNLTGESLVGISYQLYEQNTDIGGNAVVGKLVKKGEISNEGSANIIFNPDSRKKYALKLYDINSKAGEFWYFNEIRFKCGENKVIEKYLPATRIILRDSEGDLLKNHKFSIYVQKYDVDGNPIKEKGTLVSSSINTGETGEAILYLSPFSSNIAKKEINYVFSASGNSRAEYEYYGLRVNGEEDTLFEYVFSDLVLELRDATGKALTKRKVAFFEQAHTLDGNYAEGKNIMNTETDSDGKCRLEHDQGRMGVAVYDDIGRKNYFWNIKLKSRQRNNYLAVANYTRVYVKTGSGRLAEPGMSIYLYSLKEASNGKFYKDKNLKTFKLDKSSYLDLSLAPEAYLFVVKKNGVEYGVSFYAENDKKQEMTIVLSSINRISDNKSFNLQKPHLPEPLAKRLQGRILLQVESRGEAWYVDPNTHKRFYMKDGDMAYEMMRKFGLGISNENLNKIPVGLDTRFEEFDYDADYVPDKTEEALGTDMYNDDSDHDGFKDGEEIKNGYNPLGEGKNFFDLALANRLKGYILLQVESRGQAWYINPIDGKRYYMKDGDSSYQIMRFLSLGITDDNLEEIEIGSI